MQDNITSILEIIKPETSHRQAIAKIFGINVNFAELQQTFRYIFPGVRLYRSEAREMSDTPA